MDRTWKVNIDGKEHVVEIEYAFHFSDSEAKVSQDKPGRVMVDGNQVYTWVEDKELPKEVNIKIADKPAVLKKGGFFINKLDLFFEGKKQKVID